MSYQHESVYPAGKNTTQGFGTNKFDAVTSVSSVASSGNENYGKFDDAIESRLLSACRREKGLTILCILGGILLLLLCLRIRVLNSSVAAVNTGLVQDQRAAEISIKLHLRKDESKRLRTEIKRLEDLVGKETNFVEAVKLRLQEWKEALKNNENEINNVNLGGLLFMEKPKKETDNKARVELCLQKSCTTEMAGLGMASSDDTATGLMKCLNTCGSNVSLASTCFNTAVNGTQQHQQHQQQQQKQAVPSPVTPTGTPVVSNTYHCAVCKGCVPGTVSKSVCNSLPKGWNDMRGPPSSTAGGSAAASGGDSPSAPDWHKYIPAGANFFSAPDWHKYIPAGAKFSF